MTEKRLYVSAQVDVATGYVAAVATDGRPWHVVRCGGMRCG